MDIRNDVERNPLVVAIEDRDTPLEEIRALVERNPELLRQRDDGRRSFILPIHAAVGSFRPDVLKYLVQKRPESVREGGWDRFVVPIHRAVDAHVFNPKYRFEGRQRTAEEEAVLLETVRILVEAWPEGLDVEESQGELPLHCACRASAPCSVVRYLADSRPKSVRTRDVHGFLPLHYLVQQPEPSVPTIQLLVDRYPKSLRKKSIYGGTPLHDAIWHLSSEDALNALINLCPEMVRETSDDDDDEDGRTLLHEAARAKNLTAVKVLAGIWPDAARERSLSGRLPLHEAAWGGDAALCQLLLTMFPQAVRETSLDGWLPLHDAARQGHFDVVQLLVNNWEVSVREVTHKGWLPIHLSILSRPFFGWDSLRTVHYLLDRFPQCDLIKTSEGFLPLHIAASANSCSGSYQQMNEAVIVLLIEREPKAVRVASKEGLLPIHYAILGDCPLTAVQRLEDSWPGSLQRVTVDGRSVLHLAVSPSHSLGFKWKTARDLVSRFPNLLDQPNGDGWLPLHVAVARHQPLELVRLLVEPSPGSVLCATRCGSLPIHLAAGLPDVKLDVVKFLVSFRPRALSVTDADGSLPLHIAASRSRRVEQIEAVLERLPSAVVVPDRNGSLPLHRAVARGPDASLPVVQALVKKSLASVLIADASGWLPVHLAAQNDAPLVVLWFLSMSGPEALCRHDPAAGRDNEAEDDDAAAAAAENRSRWHDQHLRPVDHGGNKKSKVGSTQMYPPSAFQLTPHE